MPTTKATREVTDQIRAKIDRFRKMLTDGNFVHSQRDTIEQMVIEEEAKFAELTRQSE